MSTEVPNSIGTIFPPAALREIIDKTAQFVAKNGPEFESRILRDQSNQKFSFLMPGNPFRPYYDLRVKECQSGGFLAESVPAIPQAILDIRAKEETKRKTTQLLMLTQNENIPDEELKPPEPDKFFIRHPFVAPLDQDIIKLTAQFVARNGQKFLIGLSQREKSNPQFDFLKPSHSLFTYFTSLVDSYSHCLMPPRELIDRLKADAGDRWNSEITEIKFPGVLERFVGRHRWEASQEKKRKEDEDKREIERAQLSSIDWYDFTVVETVEFNPDDDILSVPLDLTKIDLVPPKPLAEQIFVEPKVSQRPTSDAMDTEMGRLETSDSVAVVPAAPVKPSTTRHSGFSAPTLPVIESVPIRRDYVRKSKRSFGSQVVGGRVMQKCPITGAMVAADEMTQHLKILLLDPQWKSQRDKMLVKAKRESAFAPEADMESNLASFVVKRPDLFGTVEDEVLEHSTDVEGSFEGVGPSTKRQKPL